MSYELRVAAAAQEDLERLFEFFAANDSSSATRARDAIEYSTPQDTHVVDARPGWSGWRAKRSRFDVAKWVAALLIGSRRWR